MHTIWQLMDTDGKLTVMRLQSTHMTEHGTIGHPSESQASHISVKTLDAVGVLGVLQHPLRLRSSLNSSLHYKCH